MNKGLSTPKPVLEAMARSISPDIYKSFTARYTKDIALEVRGTGSISIVCNRGKMEISLENHKNLILFFFGRSASPD